MRLKTFVLSLVAGLSFGLCLVQPASAITPIQLTGFRFDGETELRDWEGYSGLIGGWGGMATPADPSDDDPPNLTQAGAHPTLNLALHMCSPIYGPSPTIGCNAQPQNPPVDEQLDDWIVHTPPGLLGNPNALPTCSYEVYRANRCPDNTIVGYSRVRVNLVSPNFVRTPFAILYNIKPTGSELARFGAVAYPDGKRIVGRPGDPIVFEDTLFTVRSNGDFGLDSTSPDFFRFLGNPPAATEAKIDFIEVSLLGYTGNDPVNGTPFITNPTQCGIRKVTSEIDSYENDGNFTPPASVDYPVDGCENVPFNPQVEVARETTQAGAPSGYSVGIEFPDYDINAPIYESHLKDVVVEMPEGVALSAPAAEGLESCSPAQFGKGSSDAITCPSASQIGTVEVDTPVLDTDPSTPALDPLEGKVYFAEPTASDPWRIFIGIEDANLRIKLEGDVEIDEDTGRITTTFADNPQTPFTRFELKLRGGSHAILQNPVDCQPHDLEADLTPWSDEDTPTHRTVTLTSTGCSTPQPFAPTVQAFTNPKDAGAHTDSTLIVERPDGQQLLRKMDISLPPGLVGSLANVPLCSRADGLAGSCSDAAKIGSVKVAVGAGATPITVFGAIYLTDPLEPGDAAGLSIVVPAKTGPIDLGAVVATSRVKLRQADGGIDVSTSDLPRILKGIHLPVRKLEVLVDREGFFQNPTSCDPRSLTIGFTSHGDATATGQVTDSATNCGALPFAPKLDLSVSGETGKNGHPALRAVVTQDPGQSNISRAEVLLPQVLRPDVPTLNKPGKLCHPDQIAVNACPAPSNIGSARVFTPLLPEPLSGPVYIVQDPSGVSPLPRLVVQLRGMVGIDLGAQNLIKGVRTMNVFENLPDVPQTRFELNIVGGKEGILKNFVDLCENPDIADATFTGHSGANYSESPRMKVSGCKGGLSFGSTKVRASKRGVVPLKLRCSAAGESCDGKLSLANRTGKTAKKARALGSKSFSIQPGETQTVRVKLSRQGRSLLKRKRRLRLRASAELKGVVAARTAKTTISVRAAKKRTKKRK